MTSVEEQAQFARIEVEVEEAFCHLTHLLDQCDHGTLAAQFIVVLNLLLNMWKQECAGRSPLLKASLPTISDEELAAMEEDEEIARTHAEEINEARARSTEWRRTNK